MSPSLATVLVVDDAPDVRLLARVVLTRSRFAVLEATGGSQALAILRDAEPVPDVIVLDVQMPDLDGWDTLVVIRNDPRTRQIPVVLCTVKAHVRDMNKAWEMGADGFLNKPFSITDLTDAVRVVLARSPEDREEFRRVQLEETRHEMSRRPV